ncbi:TonB-dependent receptor [Sphingobacterium chuzhouense]|uniref:TonB-dependent receptor n=1 Tax=Sphingobacterium chuzhouense TaxID=1742264 RepID=A0ABR7XLD0_9SPHI|nr:TonB-dependent receptor [Sphingobacterium chuzhouense]MBD1419982.1 TonB-dependent receptor [Sphingobacterium chuzhouense]
MRYKICILSVLLLISRLVLAQTTDFATGYVYNEDGIPLGDVTVQLGNNGTTTLSNGHFSLESIPAGKHLLTVSVVGYSTFQDTVVKLVQENLALQIRLSKDDKVLQEVMVVGKSETQQVREQAIRAIVVDTRAVAEQPVTLSELMNRSPGIRIRQSGGLGNAVDVSINGFQGNSVQYFRDGIPLEYLGGGYGINNVPVNQLERVEVYKGVVPMSLGGDALGGAVNLVRPKHKGSSILTSYEIASFNTHIINLSAYQSPSSKKYFVGLDAFLNYSDNDYKADVEIVDANSNPQTVTLPLFHNGYKHYFAEAYGGIRDVSWADELQFGLAAYNIDRESQHPARMTTPYGALKVYNKGIIPSLRYQKAFGNINIDQFISYSHINRSRVDTIKGSFDWYGNFRERIGGTPGESPRPSHSDINFSNIINRTNLSYFINKKHRIEANLVYNYISRLGEDPLGFRFEGTDIDVLTKEATYSKTIGGLMWESKWLNNKLTNQLMGKFFGFNTKGINAFMANDVDLDKYKTYSNNNWGIGHALKYQLSDHDFIRASWELTNRLPRENELFGDNDTRAPNFELEPERSFNVNIGYRFQKHKLTAEVSGFYRKTDGMILLVPIQPPFAQYRNLDSIRGYGFDVDLSYLLTKNLQVTANATWQDNRMVDIPDGVNAWMNGTRVRNTPYFFANAGITGSFGELLTHGDRIKTYLHWNFIREFYLNHIPRENEPKGFLGLFGQASVPVTNIVPNQHLITAGFNYFLPKQPISFGIEVKNLANAKLYDYYKIQRPGRSFHFKINYQLTKNSI